MTTKLEGRGRVACGCGHARETHDLDDACMECDCRAFGGEEKAQPAASGAAEEMRRLTSIADAAARVASLFGCDGPDKESVDALTELEKALSGPARSTIAQRLDSLREWSGKTDAMVIAEATDHTMPRDPQYAEWLVLLGRSDLL